MARVSLGWAALLACWCLAPPALAQDTPAANEPQPGDEVPEESHEVVGKGEAAEGVKNEPTEGEAVTAEEVHDKNYESDAEREQVDEALAAGSAVELPDKTYYFVGARYRGIIVPKFVLNLFAEGGSSAYVNGFGPEFAIRKNGFEYNLSAWLAFYGLKDTLFKGKSDGENAWEIDRSEIKILYASSDFMWTSELAPGFGLAYGGAFGIGYVFGNLYRTQAYLPPGETVGDVNAYEPCRGPNNPGTNATQGGVDYCTGSKHYGESEPNWANGGDKPLVFPWLALQAGLRYKPHKNFVARLDLGVGTSAFFFGIGADYGL